MDGHSLYPDRPEHRPEIAERAFRRGPILLRLLLSALLDAQQHRAIHDQITRLKQEVHEAQYCLPPRTGACPQQQPRPAVVRFVEDELQSSPVNPHLHQPGPHLGRRRGNGAKPGTGPKLLVRILRHPRRNDLRSDSLRDRLIR